MASGTADLQRDLGGAVMQSIFGALLTAGYAAAVTAGDRRRPDAADVSSATQAQLTKSFSSAEAVAQQYPQYAAAITEGAKTSFLAGADWAYLAGIAAVLLGGARLHPVPRPGRGTPAAPAIPRRGFRSPDAGRGDRHRTPDRSGLTSSGSMLAA